MLNSKPRCTQSPLSRKTESNFKSPKFCLEATFTFRMNFSKAVASGSLGSPSMMGSSGPSLSGGHPQSLQEYETVVFYYLDRETDDLGEKYLI